MNSLHACISQDFRGIAGGGGGGGGGGASGAATPSSKMNASNETM